MGHSTGGLISAVLCSITINAFWAMAQQASTASTVQPGRYPQRTPVHGGTKNFAGLPELGRQLQQDGSQTSVQPSSPINYPVSPGPNYLGAYSAEALCAQGPNVMQGYPVQPPLGGMFGLAPSGSSANPCTVTCYNDQSVWMVAKPHGAPCRAPTDPLGERYCYNQLCVVYNSSLNDYCRASLSLSPNSPDYMALMPYSCTVACLDKSIPSVVQVQFTNGMSCRATLPGGRQVPGYCMNGACSTLTPRGPGRSLLDPRMGVLAGAGAPPGPGYPNPYGNDDPFALFFGRR